MTSYVTEYDDNYTTCSATFATLRIYPGELSVEEVTSLLNIEPTSTQAAEERPRGVRNRPAGWFLTSEGAVESRDVRRHVDWILDQIENKSDVFQAFRKSEVQAGISCYWVSASGHGGPSLWPCQMTMLGLLGLEICFDVYAN